MKKNLSEWLDALATAFSAKPFAKCEIQTSAPNPEQEQKVEQARLTKQQQQAEQELLEETRIAKERAETFVCKRCPAKYPSNTKLHEHIRDHHAKKSKSIISSPSTPPSTPPQSVVSSADTLKPSKPKALPPTPPHSVTSSPPSTPRRATSPKTSPLSGSALEFVPKRAEITSFDCPLTPPQKPASMRLTPPFKTPSKTPYLTIHDLHRMFAGKDMRAKLFATKNSPVSPGVSAPRQARITSYFLPTSAPKSTKSEASTSVHAPVKQSARASPSRSPFRPSPSARSSFPTNICPPPVCWRCQGAFVTCLPSNWTWSIAARAGIPVGRRGCRHSLKNVGKLLRTESWDVTWQA